MLHWVALLIEITCTTSRRRLNCLSQLSVFNVRVAHLEMFQLRSFPGSSTGEPRRRASTYRTLVNMSNRQFWNITSSMYY
jgi:hypothetical protein